MVIRGEREGVPEVWCFWEVSWRACNTARQGENTNTETSYQILHRSRDITCNGIMGCLWVLRPHTHTHTHVNYHWLLTPEMFSADRELTIIVSHT